MDKQTLSNYGWLVIVTLILAVMLALATPFGTYVGDAVVSVANGFVGSSNQAMDDDNIGSLEQQWADKLNNIGATFTDGTFLTWGELQLAENGTKYGYDASAISDTTIGDDAFMMCNSLTSITIPDGVMSIADAAFFNCTLTNITIPDSVTSINTNTFRSCVNLKSITFEGTTAQWNAIISTSDAAEWYIVVSVHCSDGIVSIS